MPEKKEVVAVVIGKLLSDPVFRAAFSKNATETLKHSGMTLGAKDKEKLTELSKKLAAGRLSAIKPSEGAALHCEVASSVGYA